MRRSYERFAAWRLCHELALAVYESTRSFPSNERFELVSQARRAAFSAAANIVEGSSRRGSGAFRRSLDISLGSLTELAYTLRFARDVHLLSHEQWAQLDALRRRAGYLTWRLHQAVRRPRKKT